MTKTYAFCLLLGAALAMAGCRKENALAPGSLTDGGEASPRDAVVVPAGSVDQLALALQSGSTVILAPGLHTETGTVLVEGYHNIIGQQGAVLRMNSTPLVDYEIPISVGLHFKNAGNASLRGVTIESANPVGGTAILIENSPKVSIQRCNISGFQFGILVEKSPLANIFQNKIAISTAWQTGEVPEAHGIVVINGEGVIVDKNEVSGALFGIWACDKNGTLRRNYTHDNYLGIILCKVPFGNFILPGGSPTGAQFSCAKWTVRNNVSDHNLNVGYLVIDGANNNRVEQNEASENGAYDYELTGDSYRFGFLTPFCFNNTVKVEESDTVKDCGQNNTVIGGIAIDTAVDPCN